MGDLCVFDIQRNSYHDGPGIRTTIFLKGCPLSCVWCHNPESKNFKPQMGCLFNLCINCGECERVCPAYVHTFLNSEHKVDFSKCILCGACIESCPPGAMKLYGENKKADDLISLVLKDEAFYKNSGGGLTVSGGEPMSQFEGLKELLKKAKEANLHTCLDTCGYAPRERYEEIMPLVDLFLFDYKLAYPQLHKEYTGVDNALILSNLAFLNGAGAQIFLRCPIIPGINDDDGHLREIARLSREYGAIKEVNVMAYHDMAKGKVHQIGEEYAERLIGIKTVDREGKKTFYDRLEALGCMKLAES